MSRLGVDVGGHAEQRQPESIGEQSHESDKPAETRVDGRVVSSQSVNLGVNGDVDVLADHERQPGCGRLKYRLDAASVGTWDGRVDAVHSPEENDDGLAKYMPAR